MNAQEQHTFWLKFHRFQQRYEKIYTVKFNKALREQINEFIDHGTMISITSIPVYKVMVDLYKTVSPIWAASATIDTRRQKARMPMGFSQRIVDLMIQYYGIDFLNMCEGITETTKKSIQNVLNDAAREGFGFDEIVKRLSNENLTSNRARLIARTETVGAANAAANIAALETGLQMDKIWIATYDNRTRQHHVEINQTIVPMDQKFPIGPTGMDYPGDKDGGPDEVCNCRCTHAFIVRKDVNGNPLRVGDVEKPVQPFTPISPIHEFIAAKTIKEAEQYALNILDVNYANYKGLDLSIANQANESLFRIQQGLTGFKIKGIGSAQKMYSELKKKVTDYILSTNTYRNTVELEGKAFADNFVKRWVKVNVGSANTQSLAFSVHSQDLRFFGQPIPGIENFTGIFINEIFGKKGKIMDEIVQDSASRGWFTKGAKDFEYVMTHELAHEVDRYLGITKNGDFLRVYTKINSSMSVNALSTELSRYGATAGGFDAHKPQEFLAEAFAEYLTSPTPRKIAQQVGELVFKIYYDTHNKIPVISFEIWLNSILKIIRQ